MEGVDRMMVIGKVDAKDLFDKNDKELLEWGCSTINLDVSDIVAPEMTRRLNVSIKEFNQNSSKH